MVLTQERLRETYVIKSQIGHGPPRIPVRFEHPYCYGFVDQGAKPTGLLACG
jgi:hypothetical protein